MPLSTDVKLPRHFKPRFPDRCACCGVDDAPECVKITQSTIGWVTVLTLLSGNRFSVLFPACNLCAPKLRREKRMRWLLTWSVAIVGVAVGFWLLDAVDAWWRRWAIAGVAMVCCSPLFLWQVFRPAAIDLTVFPRTVDYEFASSEYADEFARLNSDHLV